MTLSRAIYLSNGEHITISNISFRNNRGVDIDIRQSSNIKLLNITGLNSYNGCYIWLAGIINCIFDGFYVNVPVLVFLLRVPLM